MTRLVLFLSLLFFFSLIIEAQEESVYSAITLAINGEGVVSRKSEEIALEFPQRFMPGDVVTIKNGSAIVMLFSGQEVTLSAVSNYTIPADNSDYTSPLAEMANNKTDQNLLSQSGAAYALRKPGGGILFPRNSKVVDKANVVLRLHEEIFANEAFNLVIKDSQTQRVVYKLDSINSSSISLAEVPFVKGKSYYWTLTNARTKKADLGTIVFPTENKLQTLELESHFDYINAISELYSEGYFFDAYELVNKAMKLYPEYKIYRLMKKRIEAN